MKDIVHQNTPFLMKVAYAILTKPNVFWVQAIRAKYRWEGHGFTVKNTRSSSYLWKSLSLVWPEVEHGSKWTLGDGQQARFWADHWIGDLGPLKNLATAPIPELELQRPVGDFVEAAGTWKRYAYEHWLPSEVADMVTQSPPPRTFAEPDSQY